MLLIHKHRPRIECLSINNILTACDISDLFDFAKWLQCAGSCAAASAYAWLRKKALFTLAKSCPVQASVLTPAVTALCVLVAVYRHNKLNNHLATANNLYKHLI